MNGITNMEEGSMQKRNNIITYCVHEMKKSNRPNKTAQPLGLPSEMNEKSLFR